jgi:pantoate--beta-alanine ligase
VELLTSRQDFRAALQATRAAGSMIGLVPTMGALHRGHLSLVGAARSDCDIVAVTIFVNPTQFGDASDLAAYPRDLASDLALTETAGADFVFAPSVEEMYPGGPPAISVNPGELGEILEGASRPGHFAGVATIVTRLLCLAGACRAYFGDKDFQQLAIIRRLVADLDIPVEIVGCPTVREADGLAMSSRNGRLDEASRQAATALWRALGEGRDLIEAGERDACVIENEMQAVLRAEALVIPDYAVAVDPLSLQHLAAVAGEVRLLVAARVEPVRLIDNEAAIPPPIPT